MPLQGGRSSLPGGGRQWHWAQKKQEFSSSVSFPGQWTVVLEKQEESMRAESSNSFERWRIGKNSLRRKNPLLSVWAERASGLLFALLSLTEKKSEIQLHTRLATRASRRRSNEYMQYNRAYSDQDKGACVKASPFDPTLPKYTQVYTWKKDVWDEVMSIDTGIPKAGWACQKICSGGWTLPHHLGRGRTSTVYLAIGDDDRRYAVKVSCPGYNVDNDLNCLDELGVDVLEAAHGRKIFHRDIRADNIMIAGSFNTGQQRLFLLDWGYAASCDAIGDFSGCFGQRLKHLLFK
ncbi:hypothetical protein GOP47_0016915 [Adiantum capillus-veneris]|uniref:Uncharacterized protein n=1 Tax=Adiantum capillus-veneris TaxID=13818 RepID=A0A9D4UIM4_ADICA|nr:hypothetical protein GOP47_0016915 [Adiantum capillus-veneris]